jgi:uncharacterized membrane protein YoaK (UPF0700 family)
MHWDHNRRLAVTLGFIAGYVDTLGFVAMFGLFTAHVTGNFVLIGAELANPGRGHGVLIKFMAFLAFVLAVALTRILTLALERRNYPPVKPVFMLQLIFLIGFMLAGQLSVPIQDTGAPLAILAGMLGAASMGMQNAGGRLLMGNLPPTTMMTGNLTQLVIDAVDVVRGNSDAVVNARIAKVFWPLLAFSIGAIAGASAYVHFSFWSLALPIAILLSILLSNLEAL